MTSGTKKKQESGSSDTIASLDLRFVGKYDRLCLTARGEVKINDNFRRFSKWSQ